LLKLRPTPQRTWNHFSNAFALLTTVSISILLACWHFLTPSRALLEQQVITAMAANDLSKAEASLLQISPRDSEVLELLADVAFRQGRKQQCLKWLEELADRSTVPYDALCAAGSRAFEFARPLDAERLFRRAIQVSPKSLEPYSRLARLYLACQRGDELHRLIAQADSAEVPLRDDPTLIWLWIVGDRVDWQGDDSLKWLEATRIEQPDDPFSTAALMKFQSQSKARSSSELLQEIETMRQVNRSPWKWPLTLAQVTIELESNQFEQALLTLSQVTGDGEQQAETWLLRGRVAEAMGDLGAGVVAYQQASQLEPLSAQSHYRFGHLLAKVNRRDESEAELRTAVRLDELVRRCLQILQSTSVDRDNLRSVASLSIEVGEERWTQLVCEFADKSQGKSIDWPAAVEAVRRKSLSRLTVRKPKTAPPEFTVRRTRKNNQGSDAIPQADESNQASIRFSETTEQLGLHFQYDYGHNPERWLMETLGGGIAVLDFDLDGWPDLFLAQGGPLSSTGAATSGHGQLRRNIRGIALQEVTDVAQANVVGFSHGCAVGDINSDGFPDLLVCRYGGLTLLQNNGDGTWTDTSATAVEQEGSASHPPSSDDSIVSWGMAENLWNTSATFVDIDRDGDLDLYVDGYCHAPLTSNLRTCRERDQFSPCRPNAYPPEPDTLLMNSGTGHFWNRSASYGIHADGGYGLGVIAADFDGDGIAEIFVGNDTTNNFLWHQTTAGVQHAENRFEEIGLISGVAVDGSGRAEACMGIACGDVDGDLRLDLFVTNFFDETCTFYQNLGDLQFEDRTRQIGLSNEGQRLMGWGCQFFDADNDSWLDLAIVNGHLHDTPQLPQFYRNRNGRFRETSSSVGSYFREPKLGRSIATWDYNRDGRIDLVVSHQTEPASVLRNDSDVSKCLTMKLVGIKSVRDATGAIVRARIGSRQILRLVSSQGGYLSACSAELVIGLGDAEGVDELEIDWPSGIKDTFGRIPGDQSLVIREGIHELIRRSRDDE
jgi:enediyne biosynthesis protein E4